MSKEIVAAEAKLQVLREAVLPKGKKALWLRELADKQLVEVYQRLRMGQGAYKIAKLVQEKWNIRKDADTKSLAQAIQVFKLRTIGALKQKVENPTEAEKKVRASLQKRAAKIKDTFDAAEAMAFLANMNLKRAASLADRELQTKIPSRILTTISETAFSQAQRFMDLQQKLGLIDVAPDMKRLELSVKLEKVVGALPDRGIRMAQLASALVTEMEADCIECETDENGNFIPVDNES